MIEIIKKEDCCGCTACMNSCPKNAISMKADEEGFLYPCVDNDKCVECGVCKKVCPIVNHKVHNEKTETYVFQHCDNKILAESTSGGAFSAIAKYVENMGGIIVGAVFKDDFTIIHKDFANSSWGGVRNSKYAQSYLGYIFQDIKKYLIDGQTVLFSGTPCQVAGLKGYLQRDYDNLVTVDLVCRSIPSPKLWKSYLEYMEGLYHSKVQSVKFRNKTYGYHSGSFVATFENGKEENSSNRTNPYMKAFHMNICSRPSCYQCKFKTVERVSDFTIFDCWNPAGLVKKSDSSEIIEDNDKGYSALLVHTEKAHNLLDAIGQKAFMYKVNTKNAISYTGGMVEHSIPHPHERDEFYLFLNENGFQKTIEKFVPISSKDKVIESMKTFTYKTGLLKTLKALIKR